jgi:soluble lytic murein transglycosylase
MGLSHLKLDNKVGAIQTFNKVDSREASDFLQQKTDFRKAGIYFETQKYDQALKLYKKLEKKMRHGQEYPEILWALLKINHYKKRRLDSCYWARKLYRKYPNYSLVSHWGLRWQDNLVDGKPLVCKDSLSDQQDRIKRLQWMGESEKAYAELKEFQKTKEDQFTKDMTMAEYLVNEGMVKEAFDRLKPYYNQTDKRKDFDYVSLLAKAASRAGEYQASVGIYLKAHQELSGRDSRSALYLAAFLSYQHQDYDGALRRFQQIKKMYPHTSLARQANWYIPWTYYLKGHYQKAYDLLKVASRNRRRLLPSRVSQAKLKYWMAMSMYKLGNKEEAKKLFLEVSQDEYFGYYSIASVQRLRSIVGARGLASVKHNEATSLHENWLPLFAKEEVSERGIEFSQTEVKTKDVYYAEWEKLPYMREYLDMGKPAQIYSTLSAPEFRKHIERAEDLYKVGMQELSKWELYSIEGRTSDRDYLKTLMYAYYRNQVYHRSAYIGTRHFADDRKHLGLPIGKALWRFVYPRAFEKDVLAQGQRFGVPPEFVWSIMKAETNFRPDAVSPVGARGLMQVMTHTGRKVASMIGKTVEGSDLLKPEVSVEIGTRYLQRNLKKFKGKISLAAAAYNGGPHRVHGWLHQFGRLEMDEFIEHIPFLETRNYVKKVTRYYTLYNLIYNDDAEASSWLAENVNVYPEGTPPTRETWEVL